jgi:glucosamine 6-phosphate synthetase-like amidotransferase/phosphosugar isomerase protein
MIGPGINQEDLRAYKTLMTFSQVRGIDGSGVYQVRSNGKRNTHESIYKTQSNFSTMLDELNYDKEWRDIMSSVQVDVVIGHVRWMTRGGCSDANAHPFFFQNIVGAHNGSLRDKKYEHEKKTDSELMFADMNARGIIPVLEELDPKSAYAITVYDRNEHCLYIARNEERPLALAYLKNRSVMFWASEMGMLKYVMRRHGIEAEYFTVNPHRLLRIQSTDISCTKPALNSMRVAYRFDKEAEAAEIEEDKLKEELAKISTSATVTVKEPAGSAQEELPFQGGTTTSQVVTQAAASSSKIIPFPAVTTSKVRAFYSKCACGDKTLTLLETNYSRRGFPGYPRWDPSTQKHFCVKCDPLTINNIGDVPKSPTIGEIKQQQSI